MTEHTKGPWKVNGELAIVGEIRTQLFCATVDPLTAEKYRGSICTIQSCDHIKGITQEEAEANARLIAEAPNMLKALKFLLAGSWKSIDKDNMEFEGKVSTFQLEMARAAIAKVEGNLKPQDEN